MRERGADVLIASEVLLYNGDPSATIQAFLGRDFAQGEYVGYIVYGRGDKREGRRQDVYRGASGLEAADALNRIIRDKQHLGYRGRSGKFAQFPTAEVIDAIRRASANHLRMVTRGQPRSRWGLRRG